MYIPDTGLHFQLINIATNSRLFSREHPEPHVNTFGGPEYDDQWFTLIHGTKENGRAGKFALKSRVTPKVVFSRATGTPRVGNIEFEDRDDEIWFSFEEGTGKHANAFRILCPANSLVLYSRFTGNPTFGNVSVDQVSDDQYFKFNFEELGINNVQFHVDLAQIVKQPSESKNITWTNIENAEAAKQFEYSSPATETSLFEYESGFVIAKDTEFRCRLPYIADEKIDTGLPRITKFNNLQTFVKAYAADFTVVLPPHSTSRARATLGQAVLTVPYTITLHAKRDFNVVIYTKGIWTGLTTILEYTYSSPIPLDL